MPIFKLEHASNPWDLSTKIKENNHFLKFGSDIKAVHPIGDMLWYEGYNILPVPPICTPGPRRSTPHLSPLVVSSSPSDVGNVRRPLQALLGGRDLGLHGKVNK